MADGIGDLTAACLQFHATSQSNISYVAVAPHIIVMSHTGTKVLPSIVPSPLHFP